jgi:hypothetical protein
MFPLLVFFKKIFPAAFDAGKKTGKFCYLQGYFEIKGVLKIGQKASYSIFALRYFLTAK